MGKKSTKTFVFLLLVLSVIAIFYITLLTREPSTTRLHIFEPFYSYKQILFNGNLGWISQNLLNITLFVPFGIFAFLLLPPKLRKAQSIFLICGFAFLLSFLIESLQFIFKLGFFETDDIFNNTLGGVVGSLISILILQIKDKKYMK